MSDLEPAIRQLFDATNRGDNAAFLDAFAEDGVVDDWGRTFVTREGDRIRVGVAVSGGGYNGGGAFTFELAGDKIARMVITG